MQSVNISGIFEIAPAAYNEDLLYKVHQLLPILPLNLSFDVGSIVNRLL